jgi:pyruvate formate lyase activating enzyme
MDRPEEENLTSGAPAAVNAPGQTPAPADAPPLAEGPPQPSGRRGRRLARRRVLKYALGGAGLAGAGAVANWLFRAGATQGLLGLGETSWASAPSAEVFKGDAPTGELWELWRKRTWAREARHFRQLRRSVRCRLCPNNCLLHPGDRGRCRNRVNHDGKLYTLVYGNPCSFALDPIEKKPLFHFQPGTWIFSIATSGCGFRCLNCQNWEISQRKPEETKDPHGPDVRLKPQWLFNPTVRAQGHRLSLFPEDVVAVAEYYRDQPFYPGRPEMRCHSVAYTYSEPTCFFEYMYDTSKLARRKGLKNVWITCGYVQQEPLEELCGVLDAANVDLKSFSPEIYAKLNSGKLEPILNTLKTLKARGVWFEVTNLVVPTYTDDMDMIRRMCDWLLTELGPDYPLHFSRFHPQHKLTHLPPTPAEVLIEARKIALDAGLHYVYIGNLRGIEGGETTFCPNCKRPVIDRFGYVLRAVNLQDGKCSFCGTPIAGVWKV